MSQKSGLSSHCPLPVSFLAKPSEGAGIDLVMSQLHSFVFVKSDYRLVKVNLDEILFCEGMKDYTRIYILGRAQPLTTLQNLKALAARLPAHQFVRVHRSYIIALQHVNEITRSEVVLGKKQIPIGSNFREDLFRLVQDHF